MRLNAPAELQNIDSQADNNVLHRNRLGKADRSATRPLDPRLRREVFPLHNIRVLYRIHEFGHCPISF